jgi:hypothetical protein
MHVVVLGDDHGWMVIREELNEFPLLRNRIDTQGWWSVMMLNAG